MQQLGHIGSKHLASAEDKLFKSIHKSSLKLPGRVGDVRASAPSHAWHPSDCARDKNRGDFEVKRNFAILRPGNFNSKQVNQNRVIESHCRCENNEAEAE